ncbi:MAG: Alpha/beta hydrolase family protein [Elusimicrobia bacterium ADurb.Bin231]|nr:MAG: Alpha/beta hydrolase family protein [Elusimicrobia bacterium ADurb.Bin231]
MWLAIGKYLINLNSIIDLVHFASVPCAAAYLFIFRPPIRKETVISCCIYFSILAILSTVYFITFSMTIPDVRIIWSEVLIAIYFLTSVYVIFWLFDKFLKGVFNLFAHKIKNKDARALTRIAISLTILLFIAAPYLVSFFITHWVKFADSDNPETLQGTRYARVNFFSSDGTSLKGWFVSSQNMVSDSTVIIVPGRTASKNLFLSYAKILSGNDYNVLIFDLRGNGASGGHKYSFAVNEVNDVIAAVDYLKKTKPEFCNFIFGYGINEGATALISAAAVDNRFAAVISDNACGYDIALPLWLKRYMPNCLENNLLAITRTFVNINIGTNIPGAQGIYDKIAQVSPSPILVANSLRNNKLSRQKTIKLFANARMPKKLWLAPSKEDEFADSQYFLYILETFDLGKSKQKAGNWRISKKYD